MREFKFRRKILRAYLRQIRRIWNRLPVSLRLSSPGQAFGRHVHSLVRLCDDRKQSFGSFFLRNRAELESLLRLLKQKAPGSSLDIAVLGCSTGAEVYSFLWTIRSARPDLRPRMHAVEISQELLEFGERGIYARFKSDSLKAQNDDGTSKRGDVTQYNRIELPAVFDRLTDEELEAMFELESGKATIRPWLKEGIIWCQGDASDPALIGVLGLQDVVVANRFLCHMQPTAAESCLRNIARLVKPGGYLFVSGVDLDVRTRVARGMGWKPVMDLLREVHEGDPSLRGGWPVDYTGLEPFCEDRPDWKFRYAAVFQIGETGAAATRV
jgi:chemotaxis methyl-accepting protein methylase